MAALVLILTLAAVFILLPGFWAVLLFLSIVWMYRPDLTVLDIIRGVVREATHTLKDIFRK